MHDEIEYKSNYKLIITSAIGLWFILHFLSRWLVVFFYVTEEISLANVFFSTSTSLAVFSYSIIILIISGNNPGNFLSEQFDYKDVNYKRLLIYCCIAAAILIVEVLMIVGLVMYFNFFDLSDYETQDYTGNLFYKVFAALIMASVVAISEETFFRGVFWKLVNPTSKTQLILLIILNSVIFAFFHIDRFSGIYVIPSAIVLNIIYLKNDNLIYPVAFHFLQNFIVYLCM